MARSSEAAGNQTTTAKEYAEFADAWKQGNPDLPADGSCARVFDRAKGWIERYEVRKQDLPAGKMTAVS
jgi:hypothetical protein